MFVGYRPWNETLAKHIGGGTKQIRRSDELCSKENAPDVKVRAIEVQCRIKALHAMRV
jgi:hypothetical protein